MVGEILGRVEHSPEALWARPGSRVPRAVTGINNLVPGPLVIGPDRPLDVGIGDNEEAPALHVAAGRRGCPGFEDLADQLRRHRVRLQSTHRSGRSDDLEQIPG